MPPARRVVLLLAVLAVPTSVQADEPLPSWSVSHARSALLDFVARVTREGSPDFVPVPDRIAAFDNDGTLWSEQPMYYQFVFASARLKALVVKNPRLGENPLVASALQGDFRPALTATARDRLDMLGDDAPGLTIEEYAASVRDWLAHARHPRFDRPYTDLVFQPMRELLAYLRAHGFRTVMVSGGGADFLRVWSESVYGIPPEQVIGSTLKIRYDLKDGLPVLTRLPEVQFVDDGPGKPVGIHYALGRRPILVVGNSDGDFEMLRWITSGPGPRLGLIVHHTDAVREWAYDRDSLVGRLARALDEAPSRGWTLIDMKRDWKVIYPFELAPKTTN